MPTTYTIDTADVNEGTMSSIGYASNRNERGQRTFIVKASDTNGTRNGAAAAVYGTYSTDPAISGIPLDHAVVTRIGPYKFMVTQRYEWQSAGHWGGSSIATVCDFTLGTEWVPCYTVGAAESDGLPATNATWYGVMNSGDPTNIPRAYPYPVSCVRWLVPYRSNTNPMTSTVVGLANKVNNDSVTLLSGNGSPVTLSAGQLRFDTARITGYSNASYAFVGYYQFTARASFKVMSVAFSGGAWTATKTLNLASGDFNSAFGI